jgi:hypothetical protein
MKDYRKLFKEAYNIDFSNDFVIHHIDLDHKNNDIKNLMIMPKNLHNKYHFLLKSVENSNDIFEKQFNAKIHSNIICGDNYNLKMCANLINVLIDCSKWYDYTLYLQGSIPNIHNLKIN